MLLCIYYFLISTTPLTKKVCRFFANCILGLGWRLLIKCPIAQSKSSVPKRIIEIIYKIQNQFLPNNLDNLGPFHAAWAVWAECKQRHVSCQLQSQCRNILSHSQILSQRSSTFFLVSARLSHSCHNPPVSYHVVPRLQNLGKTNQSSSGFPFYFVIFYK